MSLEEGSAGTPEDARPGRAGTPHRARFRVIRPHASGGLGRVSLAHDEELGREVALKEMRHELADHAVSRARFLNEARITGRLQHPNIVPVYALGREVDGRPYYAMRFVRGRSLHEAIREHYAAPAAQGFRDLLRRFIEVCQAVAYAHGRGVVHRDLKPSNVMLGDYGETLVIDWGVAKYVGDRPAGERDRHGHEDPTPVVAGHPHTAAGQLLGTRAYMSPEQVASAADADAASDVYSLGAILLEILTGTTTGTPTGPKASAGTPAPALVAAGRKAMAAERSKRYASAAELAAEVERFMADEPVLAYREPAAARVGRWARRHTAQVAMGVAVVVTGAVALSVGLNLLARERGRRDRALAEQQVAHVVREQTSSRADKRVREADRQSVQVFAEMAARDAEAKRFGDARRSLWRARHLAKHAAPHVLPALDARLLETLRLGPPPLSPWPLADDVRAAAFLTPDGSRLLVGGADGRLVVLVAATGETVLILREGGPAVDALAASEDGTGALVADADGTLTLWELGAEHASSRRLPRGARVTAVAWAASADVIAACEDDGRLSVWSVGQLERRMIAALPAPAARVTLTPDGHTVIAGIRGGEVLAFDAVTGAQTARISANGAAVLEPLPGGHVLALGQNGALRSFALAGAGGPGGPLPGGAPAVTGTLAADERTLVYRDEGHALRVGALDGKAESRWPAYRTDLGIERTSYYGVVPDGRTPEHLATGPASLILHPAGRPTPAAPPTPELLAVSRDGSVFVTRDDKGRLELWPARPRGDPTWITLRDCPVSCVALSPSGELAAGGRSDTGEVYVWDTATGHELCRLPPAGAPVRAVAFNGDGTLLAVGTAGERGLRIWELATGRVITAAGGVTALAVGPDGRTFAAGTSGGAISFHDFRRPDGVKPLQPGADEHAAAVTHIAFPRDALAIVVSHDDGAVRLCDLGAAGAHRQLLPPDRAAPRGYYASFPSPDGEQGLSLGSAATPRAWRRSRRPGHATPNVPPQPCAVAAAATLARGQGGECGVLASADGRLRFYDLGTGACYASVAIAGKPLTALAASADGRVLVSAAADGTVHVLNLHLAERFAELETGLNATSQMPAPLQSAQHEAALVARWYALRGRDDWTVRRLAAVGSNAADISPLELARCRLRLGDTAAAAREFRRARDAFEASPTYLDLLVQSLEGMRPAAPGEAPKNGG